MSQCVGSAYDILSDSFKLCERVVSIFVEFIKAVFFQGQFQSCILLSYTCSLAFHGAKT
jgi:hypothetical protein